MSVAWAELDVPVAADLLPILNSPGLYSGAKEQDAQAVCQRLDEIRTGIELADTQILCFQHVVWNEVHANYITNQAEISGLSLFSKDEGGQQEQIAVWLTDTLHPRGCVKSPQVHEELPRELSDILLSMNSELL